MPFINFDNRHFSSIDKDEIDNLLVALEMTLSNKMAYLNFSEQQISVNTSNFHGVFINKINDYKVSKSHLCNPGLDWIKFEKDYESCDYLQRTGKRIENILQGMKYAKTLFNQDNYQIGILDFEYTYQKSLTTPLEFNDKYEVLKAIKSKFYL